MKLNTSRFNYKYANSYTRIPLNMCGTFCVLLVAYSFGLFEQPFCRLKSRIQKNVAVSGADCMIVSICACFLIIFCGSRR